MNNGIDSEPDNSLPRKKKGNVVTSLREPSATVLVAHQQRVTRHGLKKMFPSPPHKTPKLVGITIISPPAKTLISEKDIKQEDDWLNLPKNMPKDTRSLMDPTIKFTIKHTDGTVCRHKKTWAFYNRKPPPLDFELPDLEDTPTTTVTALKSRKYDLRSTTHTKDVTVVNISSCLDDSSNNVSADNIMTNTAVTTENKESQTRNLMYSQ